MNPRLICVLVSLFAALGMPLIEAKGLSTPDAVKQARDSDESYLQWSQKEVEGISKSTRVNGLVGGSFDLRVIHTESSYNFKLRATWFTPEVICTLRILDN